MKNRTHRRNPYARSVRRCTYPNAADRSYFVQKLVDGATSVVTCMGIVTILFFLMTM